MAIAVLRRDAWVRGLISDRMTRVAFLGSLLLLVVGCEANRVPTPIPPPTPGSVVSPTPTPPPRLRITNSGSSPAKSLTVAFPDSRISFGDVPAGTTTPYVPAPNGVFRYAAYWLEIDGEIVSQPVIDWVGEHPMDGSAFTYTIDVDPTRQRYQWVRLISVTREE
jgi:hypothetical protein